ncbi:MAG: hypothetical protein WAU01_16255 [Saprospiraceae bacterium]
MSKSLFTISIILILALLGCKNEQSKTLEKIEIYNTKGDGTNREKGQLMYKEITHMNGIKKEYTEYFNEDGTSRGKEVFIYEGASAMPEGSEYFDPANTLLSYYKYVYNNKDLKVNAIAFEGKTDEKLRIESYDYDPAGHMIKKEIKDAANLTDRIYIFANDHDGNQTEMTIIDQAGDTIAVEKYQITQKDDQNKWIEKWGFVNGTPKTFHKRMIEKQNL